MNLGRNRPTDRPTDQQTDRPTRPVCLFFTRQRKSTTLLRSRRHGRLFVTRDVFIAPSPSPPSPPLVLSPDFILPPDTSFHPRLLVACCFHGNTKPCTLKSALGRSRGETDNNIPLPRQTHTHTRYMCVCVCVPVHAHRHLLVCLSGRWVFRYPCVCLCKQIVSEEIEIRGRKKQVQKNLMCF